MVTMKEDRGWFRQDPKQEQEWLQQLSLIYGGLILIGVYMVQPFLTAGSLDLSAKICVVAFSVAIPLLAALVLVNRQEVFRRRLTRAVTAEVARVVAQLCAATGVVAGFWHIRWIAGAAESGRDLHAAPHVVGGDDVDDHGVDNDTDEQLGHVLVDVGRHLGSDRELLTNEHRGDRPAGRRQRSGTCHRVCQPRARSCRPVDGDALLLRLRAG